MAANDNRKKYSKIMDEEVDYLTNALMSLRRISLMMLSKIKTMLLVVLIHILIMVWLTQGMLVRMERLLEGREYSPEDALKVSSIVGLISENINYTDRSIANTG